MDRYNLQFEGRHLSPGVGVTLSAARYEHEAIFAAHKAFSKARSNSRRHLLWARVRKNSPTLYSLYAVVGKRPLLLRQMSGIQMVRLSDIQGSEGKSDEFDHLFRPLHEKSRARWVGVAVARAMGPSLPPVDLIRVGDIYFVRDGHHRVSVARAYGQREIEANVWVLQAPRSLSQLTRTMNVPSRAKVPFLTADST